MCGRLVIQTTQGMGAAPDFLVNAYAESKGINREQEQLLTSL